MSSSDSLVWTQWRGPEQNGVSRETHLIDHFNPRGGAGSNLLWKSEAAAGISTPIVMRGKLYTIVRDQPHTPRHLCWFGKDNCLVQTSQATVEMLKNTVSMRSITKQMAAKHGLIGAIICMSLRKSCSRNKKRARA